MDVTGYPPGYEPLRACSDSVSLEDFRAYMPQHTYIFMPTREPWPAASVNARIPPVPLFDAQGKSVVTKSGATRTMRASDWLDWNRPVEQMTWAPGEPDIVEGRLVGDGGWIERQGVQCLNLYRPPNIELGDHTKAGPWLEHVRKVYGEDAEHIIAYLANKVQKPHVKINHALVLGGAQGIGKDTLLDPVKAAVGPWNFAEVSPSALLGRFNGFLKSVILRVSEARDLGEVDRYSFYEHTKALIAAPPDVLRVDEKNLREYNVFNVTGLVLTTNHKVGGIYLPADDRRHFVGWSNLMKDDFKDGYWNALWRWYEDGGRAHVAAYLANLDIRDFDPKAPPPKTAAWWDIVQSSQAPEDAELADALDKLGNPVVVTVADVVSKATPQLDEFLRDRRNSRQIAHRFEACGYTPLRNPRADSGLWQINGRRQVIYGQKQVSLRELHIAAHVRWGV
jgi:hypothetical protein